ncbi:hypothetical protein ARSEF4850_008854 [Beauveria asiatica]
MEAIVSTSEISLDGKVRRRGGRRYRHEAPARLYWPLTGVFPAGISVMETPQSGLDELESFQKPDGTWHEVASLPLTEPPVSSVETSLRFLNEWERNWTERHGRWCKTAEYVTYGELCDEDRPCASEMKEDGSWEEDSDTEFLNRCCSQGRPMHWRGLSIRVDASTEKGFVTVYDYVSAVHPWLMSLREHLIEAKLDDPECACCVPEEAHASTWIVNAGYAPTIDIEIESQWLERFQPPLPISPERIKRLRATRRLFD